MTEFEQAIIDRIDKVDELERKFNSLQKHPLSRNFINNDEFLGIMGISSQTARRLRFKGLLPYCQIGMKIYYFMDEIETFLKNNKYKPSTIKQKDVDYDNWDYDDSD